MSLTALAKTPLKQSMKAGIHLAIIADMKLYKDSQKNPIINNDEMGMIITFANGKDERHEQIYWFGKGQAGKEKYLTKMCIDAGIDMSVTPLAKKDAIGKRLWIAIREVYTLVNDEVKKSDITGEDVIEYFIFHTSLCFDPDRIPVIKGDPAKNQGQAMEDFIAYKNEGQSGYDADNFDYDNKATLDVEELTEADALTMLINTKSEDDMKFINSASDDKFNKAFNEVVDTKADIISITSKQIVEIANKLSPEKPNF